MGLFKLLKILNSSDDKSEKEMDKYHLNKEEKEEVRKGYYEPDEFDQDEDNDEDE